MRMEFISPGSSRISIPDLYGLVFEATRQIPSGMVSTYGDIALALGDLRASRVVGMIIAANERPIVIPCHRVVYSDGKVGWYGGKGKGTHRKVDLLASEGVKVVDGRVMDFNQVRFTDFNVRPVLAEMMEEQMALRGMVVDEDDLPPLERVVGIDVSYHEKKAFAASASFDLESGDLVGQEVVMRDVHFPYIPGYLSYRELPAFEDLNLHDEGALFLVDGQGSLHPRRFGIACHVGIFFNVPTVGVAKSLLCGSIEDDGSPSVPIRMGGEIAGLMLRGSGSKGVYVSVGHRVSLKTCETICRRFMKHTIPEPLRKAHVLASEAKRERRASRS